MVQIKPSYCYDITFIYKVVKAIKKATSAKVAYNTYNYRTNKFE